MPWWQWMWYPITAALVVFTAGYAWPEIRSLIRWAVGR